jgi:SAM-dependent methyltransferase
MASERAYVLGTNDEELTRLGVQHRAWRERALAVWRLCGISPGDTVLDVGCGPGYASFDLADLVGPSGRVVAVDKSARFLGALRTMRQSRGFENIAVHETDLDGGEFPTVLVDVAWCRWVLSFVKHPRDVLARIAAALRPGGAIILHEYFDYSTWQTAPYCPEVEEFVRAVMASWRDSGGEPNIGLALPRWLEELGLQLRELRPIVDIVQPGHMSWTWLRSFVEVGRHRLVDLGHLSVPRSEAIWEAFTALEATPRSWMITPGVLEIVALQSE